jgi:hypothetical protein
MTFGYTPFDPLVVVVGTLYAAYLLMVRPVRLMAFLPIALSIYFFIPALSLLTLWRTIPLLLIARLVQKGRIGLSAAARPVFGAILLLFVVSLGYAVVFGGDTQRAIIRGIYYMSAGALFLFAYEMGQRKEGYDLFVRGFAIAAVIYAVFGAYQILAFYTGLPVRGIVYGPDSTGTIPSANGIPRINSLANEPKRLGYVMFAGALACFALAMQLSGRPRRRFMLAGGAVVALSLMTFSASYFLALVLFGAAATVLYPRKLFKGSLAAAAVLSLLAVVDPDGPIISALVESVESRVEEVETGLDGNVVYRQEFFANDYLARHPLQAVTGVGVGQYYLVLNREYGTGVGYAENGGLMPLNSTLLEITLDLSGVAALLLYGGLAVLILRLRRERFHFLALALLFLVLQSLTITTLLYIAVVAGVGLGQLRGARVDEVPFFVSMRRKRGLAPS